MKKQLFIFILIFIGIISIGCSSSNDDDNVKEPYTEYTYLSSYLYGTWKYQVSGAENINAVVTFTDLSNTNMASKTPELNLKINNKSYYGKVYYPTSGGDGSIYFRLEGKSSYSKISYTYNPNLPKIITFKIENVESYTIEKQFKKS